MLCKEGRTTPRFSAVVFFVTPGLREKHLFVTRWLVREAGPHTSHGDIFKSVARNLKRGSLSVPEPALPLGALPVHLPAEGLA